DGATRSRRPRGYEAAPGGGRVAARGNGVAAGHVLDGDGDRLRRLLAETGVALLVTLICIFATAAGSKTWQSFSKQLEM
ncbi:unnamed protein product, partial [Urochloa humidicola]